MSCCHYDDGYEDGLEEGRSAVGDTSVHLEVLEAVARQFDLRGEPERSALLRDIADEIGSWDLDRMVEKERERKAALVKLYTESRVAA